MIILKSPKNGEKLDILTDTQIKFLKSDRTDVTTESFDYLNLKKSADEDYSFPKKIRFEWEAEKKSVVEISEDKNFEEFFSVEGENFCDAENFKGNTRYFWRVVCDNEISEVFYFDTKDMFPRFIKIDGLTNVRDCGGRETASGKRVRQGLIYRGSEMNSHLCLTERGRKVMENELKINSVLDLKGSTEIVEDVYKKNYLNVRDGDVCVGSYSEWFERKAITKKIFDFLCDEKNYPLYYHCWGGADRTGSLAFLTGAFLGVSYENLVDDYEITSLSVWGVRSRNSDFWKKFMDDFSKIAGKTIEEKAKNYFLSCGISETKLEKFKKIMLG